MDGQETALFGKVGKSAMSGAAWLKEEEIWMRAAESKYWKSGPPVNEMLSVFTKTGKLLIDDSIIVRDFSDIGINNIDKTYDFTLSRLL